MEKQTKMRMSKSERKRKFDPHKWVRKWLKTKPSFIKVSQNFTISIDEYKNKYKNNKCEECGRIHHMGERIKGKFYCITCPIPKE